MDPTIEPPTIHTIGKTVIERYSKKICGVRVRQLESNLAGNWTLQATDDRLTEDKDEFKLELLSKVFFALKPIICTYYFQKNQTTRLLRTLQYTLTIHRSVFNVQILTKPDIVVCGILMEFSTKISARNQLK